MPIDRRLLALAVATRLKLVENATGYLGQIGAKNGLPGVTDTPPTPPTKSDTNLSVAPYFVIYPDAGGPGAEVDLGDTLEDLDWTVRITAAGGDAQDVLALVDRIDAQLFRWAPTVEGFQCGPLRYPPGRRVPLLIDESKTPARHYAPLEYVARAFT